MAKHVHGASSVQMPSHGWTAPCFVAMADALMTRVELVDVPLSNRKLVERFIKVPWYIHREQYPNDHWVPPLMMDRREYLSPRKNPFFDHA